MCGPVVPAAPRRRGDRLFAATGIRLSELAGIRYDPDDPRRSDIDLWQREITVRGKGRKTRVVKISYDAARSLKRRRPNRGSGRVPGSDATPKPPQNHGSKPRVGSSALHPPCRYGRQRRLRR